MTPDDHRRAAEWHIEAAKLALRGTGRNHATPAERETASINATIAQAHATLATIKDNK